MSSDERSGRRDGYIRKPSRMQQLLRSLSGRLPAFRVHDDNIKVLSSPRQFYESLLDIIASAKHTLFFSSLYISKDQHRLVRQSIRGSLALHCCAYSSRLSTMLSVEILGLSFTSNSTPCVRLAEVKSPLFLLFLTSSPTSRIK